MTQLREVRARELTEDVLAVLHAFNISREEIPELVEESGLIETTPITYSPEELIRRLLHGDDVETHHDLGYHPVTILHALLRTSDYGVTADIAYWNDIPQTHLDETLSQYGLNTSFVNPETGDDYTGLFEEDSDSRFDIRITEEDTGASTLVEFTYPDTFYESNNYPALITAVNEVLERRYGLEYIMLARRPGHWDFVLAQSTKADILRAKYGDSVSVYSETLFTDSGLEAYIEEPTPDPLEDDDVTAAITGREDVSGSDVITELFNGDDDEDDVGEDVSPVEEDNRTEAHVDDSDADSDADVADSEEEVVEPMERDRGSGGLVARLKGLLTGG